MSLLLVVFIIYLVSLVHVATKITNNRKLSDEISKEFGTAGYVVSFVIAPIVSGGSLVRAIKRAIKRINK
jgi:hypothetical protein